MLKRKLSTSIILFSIVVIFALMSTSVGLAKQPPAQGIRLIPIGNPMWKPVDFHLFSAPIGTAATGYAEFLDTMLGLLPPPNHVFHPQLGVGPGAPHQPPYDSELAEGVENQDYHEGVRFNSSEFSNGMGVWVVWMNVPNPGATGSSPDFASGPIISNNLFPIHVEGITYHNTKVFNPYLVNVDVPPLDQNLNPPFNVDGHGHFPFFVADNADFGPAGSKLRGTYEYNLTITDQTGNGWRIKAHFVVAP